ncbi:peptide ABC transporter substrate-binding protein [Hirschia litorea]|uniref:ABC transporter substrate-binding protein n=1 Tax=Hirschia litorea TaxID=1199156 RepID=A0ABW2IJD3_9PROT
MTFKKSLMASLMMSAMLGVSACGGSDGAREDETTLFRGITAKPDTMDPQKAEGTWENDIIGDMFIGLFTENEIAEAVPGMAADWDISDDGLVWTFKLRDANWSDGTPVTADDFVYSWRRVLDPKTSGAAYASLLYVLKNAQQVNAGKLGVEELGVKAIDAKTLEVRLEYPAPYLPGVLKHYVSFPVPKHVIETHGNKWTQPANIVVNGAYKLADWRIGDFMRSEKNTAFFDAQNVCFNQVVYYPYSDDDAVIRMAQTGKIDMNGSFPSARRAELEKSMPGWVRVYPGLSTDYVAINLQVKPFDDQRVRQALAMAIDREYITQEVMGAGQLPVYGFVPEGMSGYPEGAHFNWMGLTRPERLVKAKELLEAAGFGPDKPLKFEYLFRSTRENPKAAPVLQANWSDIAEWVQPDIRRVETRVLYNQLQQADFVTSDAAWVADFNDPYNYLYLLESATGVLNYGRYVNTEYDALLKASQMERDPVKRSAILKQAEKMILDDAAVIPLWNTGNQYLVNPNVTGWKPNPERIHRTRYMCRETTPEGGEG